jgi:hypothetical protein
MMYNIGLNIGPNILLFITHIYINNDIMELYSFQYILYIYILQLFLMNIVFNANSKIPKY